MNTRRTRVLTGPSVLHARHSDAMAYGAEPGPLAIAHRGGAALAPENTLAAFGRSVALGARYLETDIRVTADDELVCFHDATLDRVTDGHGPVRRHTSAALGQVRVRGTEHIPTLVELLESFPDANVTVDLKDREAIGPLLRVLAHRPFARRVCVAGAWDGWLGQVRAGAPEASTALGWRSLTTLITCSRTGTRAPRWLATAPFAHVPVRLGRFPVFVERLVHQAHDLGVRVVVWTANDPHVMHRLLEAGVDGIITDRPDLLREVLVSRDQWVPMGLVREHRPAADS
jgi:glycerophosphoryl diester phosphodiesterase